MKEIGGFFELELNKGEEYHKDAIRLNSARNCLLYIIKAERPKKIYLPYYSCNTLLEPIIRENINYEFYNINNDFSPIFHKKILSDEFFLYTNYFGVNKKIVDSISNKDKIIIDNAQAFFEKPIKGIRTIYSPRKFFGVAEGGYLYTKYRYSERLVRDTSYDRCLHLLKRIDISAQESYADFKHNKGKFKERKLMLMSKLTERIMKSINYDKVKLIRKKNFLYLHEKLSEFNELKLNIEDLNGPMIYPLLITKEGIKEKLISNKIYLATYWKKVLRRVKVGSFEYKLIRYLLPLPINQRYDLSDMKFIHDLIKKYI
ncbi:hypothetical protein [Clostridium ganghwense]|uniref:DegT/DnrJ/EryC1/StrS aminotransferase family protein n=1 Tax=Clostridium ganghwense TaxID=312089 RepID=A0ABT4CQ10_9CLOT|nr:hypothetical protein [Clostridium ganghwense]MCY6370543.1 hypothetical protein [Clostridium ganghwense]